MSLLSTVLAFVVFPLVKRNEEKERKERIAFLVAELAAYKEGYKTLVARHLDAEREVSRLNTILAAERERGVQDREQTRHWRSQADYWQQAYTSLTVPNQYGHQYTPEQLQRQYRLQRQYQQYAQAGQLQRQEAAHTEQWQRMNHNLQQSQQLQPYQQNAQHYENVGWLCTCVPDRATVLLKPRDTDG